MRALVVSGGGSKGAYAVGVVKALVEQGSKWDIILGTSTGALIAPMVAIGDIETLEKIYTSVRTKDIVRKRWLITWPWVSAMYSDKPLRKIVERSLTEERWKAILESDTYVAVCTVSLNTGKICYWEAAKMTRETFVEALMASSNQPGIMPAIKLGEEWHVDGGLKEQAPIREALRLGATEIDAIVLNPEGSQRSDDRYGDRMLPCFLRSLQMFVDESLDNDVRVHTGNTKLRVIRPDTVLNSDGLHFDPEEMRGMLERGYREAQG